MTAFFVGQYNFLFCSVLLTFTGEINQRNQENEVPLQWVLSKESSGFKNFYERKARVSRLLKVNIWRLLFAHIKKALLYANQDPLIHIEAEFVFCCTYFLISDVCKKSVFCIQNMTHWLREGGEEEHTTAASDISSCQRYSFHHHITMHKQLLKHQILFVYIF